VDVVGEAALLANTRVQARGRATAENLARDQQRIEVRMLPGHGRLAQDNRGLRQVPLHRVGARGRPEGHRSRRGGGGAPPRGAGPAGAPPPRRASSSIRTAAPVTSPATATIARSGREAARRKATTAPREMGGTGV